MFKWIGYLQLLLIVEGAISLSVSSWILTRHVRQRMKKTLGRKPSDLELASLKTWMEVEQEEELNKAVKLTHGDEMRGQASQK
jgi:hypothetical protein